MYVLFMKCVRGIFSSLNENESQFREKVFVAFTLLIFPTFYILVKMSHLL